MTKEQQAWVETQKKALSQHPKKAPEYPDHRMRRALCKLVESTYFEVGVLMAIMVNILFMALEHYKMSTTFTRMLSTADLAFTIMFALEAAIKIVAYYPAQYLSSGWNRFDAMVVVGNAIGIITKQGVGANVLRIFRVARIFRLLRQLRGLRMLFTTLVLSIPTMLNVAGLSLILFFVYAILGISLFGKVVRTDVLNTYLNFENFGTAMVLLFQMANGEAWNDVMIDYQVAPPTCDNHTTPYCKSAAGVELQQLLNQGACLADSSTNVWVTEVDNCGLSTISPIYFCSFQILGTFIMMNLVIAVVMENFSMSRDAGSKEVTQDDIEDFSLVWTQFDPAARGFIKLDSLPALLQAVEPPLGLLGVVVSRHHLLRFQKELNLKVGPDHRVYYHELLTAMSQKAMGLTLEQLPADVRCALQQRTKEGRKKAESRAPTGDAGANGVMFVDEDGREVEADAAYIYSTKLIQAAMRGYLHRKRLRQAREEQEQEGAYARAQAVASHVIELLDSAVLEHQPMSSTPYAEGAETIHANYFQDGTRRGPPQFDQLGAQRLAVPDSRPAGSPARMLVRQNRSPLPFMEPNPLYDELNR
ncbi:hypothetical protein WJX72_002338 [[Myrmecia] bisecta]|uniref:Uncharacterized protein n=1 Tax=[Myrmecia] bisecta TaxID=41462 RepID=A0AAW1Q6Q2_9CHLO